jgi:methionyl-tRNA formyltransferase
MQALLATEHEIPAIVTQPDSPAGRGMQLRSTPLAELAEAEDICVLKPNTLGQNAELLSQLRGMDVAAIAVASYGKIIPRSLLNLSPWPLNVHPSPLPLLRGASPLRSALLAGWERTAVCIMRMTPRIDDGPVLLRQDLSIQSDWNYAQLEAAAGVLGGNLLTAAFEAIESGAVVMQGQDDSQATYSNIHRRPDTFVTWAWSASRIWSFVKAWDPDLGAVAQLETSKGFKLIKLWRVEPDKQDAGSTQPGTVVGVGRSSISVQTGKGVIHVLELQTENRPRMSAGQFLTGYKLRCGDRFISRQKPDS